MYYNQAPRDQPNIWNPGHIYEEVNTVDTPKKDPNYLTPIHENGTESRTKSRQFKMYKQKEHCYSPISESELECSDETPSETFVKELVSSINIENGTLGLPVRLPSEPVDCNQNIINLEPRYISIPSCVVSDNPTPCNLQPVQNLFDLRICETINTDDPTDILNDRRASSDLPPNEQTETGNETESQDNGESNKPTKSLQRQKCSCLLVTAVLSLVGNVLFVIMLIYVLILLYPPPSDPPPTATPGQARQPVDDETFKRSVCFTYQSEGLLGSCHGGRDVYRLETNDNKVLCCMKNAEHIQWLIKIAQIRKLSENRIIHGNSYDVDSAHVVVGKDKSGSALVLKNHGNSYYEAGSVKVAPQGITVNQDGNYVVYIFLTLNSTAKKDRVTVKLYKNNDRILNEKHKIIHKNVNNLINMFSVLTLKRGDVLSPWLSSPSVLYGWHLLNSMGIMKV